MMAQVARRSQLRLTLPATRSYDWREGRACWPHVEGDDEWTPVEDNTECPLCGKPLHSQRIFHKECADAEQMAADGWGDPAYNNHPASFGSVYRG